jgi:hypothetical protein
MTKKIYCVLAVGTLAGFLSATGPLAWAQNAAEKNQSEKSAPDKGTTEKRDRDKVPSGTYRVEFRIVELEGEKKLNSRSYSLILTGNAKGTLHAGTRVPVSNSDPSKPGTSFSYFDVGQRIDGQVIGETERTISLRQFIEFNNFALPEQASGGTYLPPMIRTFNSDTTSTVDLGKPTIISILDDPSSKHTFQIEVTATRLKE